MASAAPMATAARRSAFVDMANLSFFLRDRDPERAPESVEG
jgi:hypothetical protein